MFAWLSRSQPDLPAATKTSCGLRSGTRSELWVACLFVAFAALVCFHRLTWHPTDTLAGPHDAGRTDTTTDFGPRRQFQYESIRTGSLPVWNSRVMCGFPFVGNPQSGFIYPFNWIFFAVASLSLLSWMMVLHHALAGLGTYLLIRRYGCSLWPALLSATAFLVGPFFVAATAEGHYTQTCVIAWIPWAAWGYERIRRGERLGIALTAGAVSLSFFGGHAQETMYLVLLLSGFLLLDLYAAWREQQREEIRRLGTAWIAVLVTIVGLVMVDLLPIWIYTKQAVRAGGIDAAAASSISLGWSNFWQLLDPFVLGGPGQYRGEGSFYWETLCYFGTTVLFLALIAILFRPQVFPIGRWTIVAIVTLLFALGDDTPLFPVLHRYLPGVSFFRSPSRSLYFATLAFSVLAGLGMQSVWYHFSSISYRSLQRPLMAVGGMLILVSVGLGFWRPELPGIGALNWLVLACCITASLLLMGIVMLRPTWRSIVGPAFVLLVLVEGTWHAHYVTATIPASQVRQGQPVQTFLTKQRLTDRVIAEQDLLSDREALIFQLSKLGGLESVPLARAVVPIVMLSHHSQPVAQLVGFDQIDLAALPKTLLDLTGTRYAAVRHQPDSPPALPGWQLVEQGQMAPEFALRGVEPLPIPYAIYAVEDPLPRAFVLGTVELLSAKMPLEEQVRRLNPREKVLLTNDLLPPGERQPLQPATIVEDRGDRLRIAANLTAPGYLVVSDTYYPGWTARVNGKPTPIVPANIGFRAIPLGPGQHEVMLEFWPPGFNFGAVCSVTTLVLLILLTRRPLNTGTLQSNQGPASAQQRAAQEQPALV